MMRYRSQIGVFLALCLVLSSISLAVARVQPPMAGWVELCGAAGPMAVDADGRPVGPVHLCPDCIAAFAMADIPGPQAAPLPPQSWRPSQTARDLVSQWAMTVRAVEARGPPPLI